VFVDPPLNRKGTLALLFGLEAESDWELRPVEVDLNNW